jgi:N-acetyl-anhydromuramyl-L-alanine amidase AmpD
MYEVKNHFLFKDGEQVEYIPSPDHGGIMEVRILVIHYTATEGLQSPLSWLTKDDDVQVSAHLIVDLNGKAYQLVPFNIEAWHAGKSSYEEESVRGSVNRFAIGIENVGTGDDWTPAQMEANRAIIEALFTAYPTIEDVVGHSDVAPGRKPDPGPNYDWDKVTSNA